MNHKLIGGPCDGGMVENEQPNIATPVGNDKYARYDRQENGDYIYFGTYKSDDLEKVNEPE